MPAGVGIDVVTVTIAAASSLSPATYIGAGDLVAIQMPAAWTAAGLAFQGSLDGVTFQSIRDNAAEVIVAAAAAINISIPPNLRLGTLWLKIRSGTEGAPVNQAAAAVLTLLIRKVPAPNLK